MPERLIRLIGTGRPAEMGGPLYDGMRRAQLDLVLVVGMVTHTPRTGPARGTLWSSHHADISQGYARARARAHANPPRALARAYWGKSPQIQQNSACTTEEKL